MKLITKNDLLALGFDEEYTSAEESGGNEFYYYTFNVGNKCFLISDADDESRGNYTIEFFEFYSTIKIKDLDSLTKLLDSIKPNIVV